MKIEIDGSALPGDTMLSQTTSVVLSTDVALRGLVFVHGRSLDVFSDYPRFVMEGCYVGVDAAGNPAGARGVSSSAPSTSAIGSADRHQAVLGCAT